MDDTTDADGKQVGANMTSSDTSTEDRIGELESEKEELEERVQALEQAITAENVSLDEEDVEGEDSPAISFTRRGALVGGLASLGLLGAAGTASANVGDSLKFGSSYNGAPSQYGLQSVVDGSGNEYGLDGRSKAPQGTGILGRAEHTTGNNFGLRGVTRSENGVGLRGTAEADTGPTKGIEGVANSPDGRGLQGLNTASSGLAIGVAGETNSPDGYAIMSKGDLWARGNVEVEGDLEVNGTKHFVQAVDTTAGSKEVVYTSVEAGRPHTEYTDVASLSDGRAEIELPEHFGLVTSSDDPIAVQVTPYAKEKANPQVVHRSTQRVVVEDFSDGAREYSFAITVKGVRDGFEDKEVMRDAD